MSKIIIFLHFYYFSIYLYYFYCFSVPCVVYIASLYIFILSTTFPHIFILSTTFRYSFATLAKNNAVIFFFFLKSSTLNSLSYSLLYRLKFKLIRTFLRIHSIFHIFRLLEYSETFCPIKTFQSSVNTQPFSVRTSQFSYPF